MIKHQASKSRMQGFVKAFEAPVNPAFVPDYLAFVPHEKQMWLRKLKDRVSQAGGIVSPAAARSQLGCMQSVPPAFYIETST